MACSTSGRVGRSPRRQFFVRGAGEVGGGGKFVTKYYLQCIESVREYIISVCNCGGKMHKYNFYPKKSDYRRLSKSRSKFLFGDLIDREFHLVTPLFFSRNNRLFYQAYAKFLNVWVKTINIYRKLEVN